MSVLLMTVWLTGCVQEEFESTPSPAGNGIRFTLTVPDVNLPSVSSRSMTGTGTAKKEDEIETHSGIVSQILRNFCSAGPFQKYCRRF